jgi:hypothetical protein
MKKYTLVKSNFTIFSGSKLYQIKALQSFNGVRVNELGGYIENERNLSQGGDAWVHKNAVVYGNAEVYENAKVYGNARVFGNAKVYGNAKVCGDARVYENAKVYGNAEVCGDARVYENAKVYGNARVFGNARVYENARILFGELSDDIFKNLKNYIYCSLNVLPNPVTKTYILYKRVNRVRKGRYASCWDRTFVYYDGKYKTVKNPNMNKSISCSSGIHISVPNYWSGGNTLIAVEVREKDIITCQEGKLRCRKVKVLGEIEL